MGVETDMKPRIRHELKYYITEGEYIMLRSKLDLLMERDENSDSATGLYHIRSLYFDDVYNNAMWDKMDGLENREKYRMRIYNLSDNKISMERKRKYNRWISKESTLLSKDAAQSILQGDTTWMMSQPGVLQDMYLQMRTNLLRPVVIVDYYREAFVYPPGNVRITFDSELTSGQFSHDLFSGTAAPVPVLEPGEMILEVKYDTFLPVQIREIIMGTRGLRSAISKYAICRRYH